MRGLTGKRVLVTGGAQGIGAATAARFIDERAEVAVLDRNPEALAGTAARLPSLAATIRADVSAAGEVAAAFAEIDRLWGGLDVLVNNAGISIRHRFLDITQEEWRRVIQTNLDGVFYVAREAARRMTSGNGGVILNMGSTNGIMGYHHYADYNASKAGVIELSRSMALELAPRVRVNCVCPGYILTPMQEAEYTPEMLRACAILAEKISPVEFVLPLAGTLAPDFVRNILRRFPVRVTVIRDEIYDVIAVSDAAMVASGTATLETALLETP
ncbi:MAG: SDR family NAD(P)-dependent oxidoreductase, partial [Longimicrobiales bacterium]|nr:SDR family NAD(P)-dependent oxidoreductase [Longimicrobiales bacterium]